MTASALTGIIDYGVGNLRSVQSAVERVGGIPLVTSNPARLLDCPRLILPGVGAFRHGMAELETRGLSAVIRQAVAAGTPLLGICLGMQMLTTRSFEFGDTPGLGLTAGTVTRLERSDGIEPLRLPHVAWKPLRRVSGVLDWFFDGIGDDDRFYFIHSLAVQDVKVDVAALADHDGLAFAAVMTHGSVIGTQFHPEKSGPAGLKLLSNFVSKGH